MLLVDGFVSFCLYFRSFTAKNGRVLLYGDLLLMDDVVIDNYLLRQRMNVLESCETDRETLRTASKIRSEI
jgi:hypothetical protein